MIEAPDLIESLYEAALMPEKWPRALEGFCDLADGRFAGLLLFDGHVSRWTGANEAAEVAEAMAAFERHHPLSRIERALNNPRRGFITDFDLFDADEMDSDPFYVDFLRPRGYGWMAGAMIDMPSGEKLAFNVTRAYARGPVERAVVERLDGLRPHLGRAALLSARLSMQRAEAMTQTLESIGLAAAVLTGDGRLLHANSLFIDLMPGVFHDGRRRLSLRDHHADARLHSYLAGSAKACSLGVPGARERAPLVVHLVPVCGSARDVFSQAATILLAEPVARRRALDTSVLQALFDLTPAEAALAREIAEAGNLADISTRTRLSPETLRCRLKSVFAKTRTHRQSELANLLAGSPPP